MLKKRFSKNFFFHENLENGQFFFLGQKSLSEKVWTSKTDHTLDTFKHFLFYFHDIFFPIFFPYVPLWSEISRKKYQKNVFFK